MEECQQSCDNVAGNRDGNTDLIVTLIQRDSNALFSSLVNLEGIEVLEIDQHVSSVLHVGVLDSKAIAKEGKHNARLCCASRGRMCVAYQKVRLNGNDLFYTTAQCYPNHTLMILLIYTLSVVYS